MTMKPELIIQTLSTKLESVAQEIPELLETPYLRDSKGRALIVSERAKELLEQVKEFEVALQQDKLNYYTTMANDLYLRLESNTIIERDELFEKVNSIVDFLEGIGGRVIEESNKDLLNGEHGLITGPLRVTKIEPVTKQKLHIIYDALTRIQYELLDSGKISNPMELRGALENFSRYITFNDFKNEDALRLKGEADMQIGLLYTNKLVYHPERMADLLDQYKNYLSSKVEKTVVTEVKNLTKVCDELLIEIEEEDKPLEKLESFLDGLMDHIHLEDDEPEEGGSEIIELSNSHYMYLKSKSYDWHDEEVKDLLTKTKNYLALRLLNLEKGKN